MTTAGVATATTITVAVVSDDQHGYYVDDNSDGIVGCRNLCCVKLFRSTC